jgi:putative ABC transport system permease protein
MRNLFSMFLIIIKRLLHSLGLTVSALVGIICVLTIAICIPVFAYAVSGELLRQELNQQAQESGHPLFSIRMYYLYDSNAPLDIAGSQKLAEYLPQRTEELVGITPAQVVIEVNSPPVDLNPLPDPQSETWSKSAEVNRKLKFGSLEGLPNHAVLVDGEWPTPQDDPAGPIRVAIHQELANMMFMNVGQRYQLPNGSEVEIAGVWIEKQGGVPFFYEVPSTHFSDLMWAPYETFRDRVSPMFERPIRFASWYQILDEADVKFQRARQYTNGMLRLDTELNNMALPIKMDYSPLEPLVKYQGRVDSLTTLLYAVGAPLAVLALLFIGLTSAIVIQEYEQEIAMLRSRGASQWEIVLMNLTESLILVLIAIPFALMLGWLASNVMGHTKSFLQFIPRPMLLFSYNGLNLIALLGAVGLVILARFSPTWRVSHRTIIKLKQEQSRGEAKPTWQRYYLDFVLLAVAGYSYLSLRGWGATAAFLNRQGVDIPRNILQNIQPDVQAYRDPLLFIAPAIFAIAVSMIIMRLVPWLARLLILLVGRLPGVWHYLSLQQIARRPQDYSSALLLIMISLSLAIFSATAAKTLDQWLYDSIQYGAGADLVIWEHPPSAQASSFAGSPADNAQTTSIVRNRNRLVSSGLTMADLGGESEWSYTREQHRKIAGVEDITRVGRYPASFSSGFGELPAEIIGIDRLEFPQVGFWREDFSNVSLGALMNALGADPNALIVPRQLAKAKNLQIGDQVSMKVNIFDQKYNREFTVSGFYDYFPTVYPQPEVVVIANLETIFGSPDSIVDYDTWFKLAPSANPKEVQKGVQDSLNLVPAISANAIEALQIEQEGIERVGLFGVLNVGFLTAGLMPAIGFILYSYASLRRRFIQLGILQAIGLSVRQLTGYLASEQLLLMGIAILGGALVGLLSSRLYVPFLQSEVQPIPPFQIFSGLREAAWLSLMFAIVLLLTVLGTITYLTRLKVFQAIKLGETI